MLAEISMILIIAGRGGQRPSPENPGQASLSATELYYRYRDSVVSINSVGPDGTSAGSGFFFEDGLTILTCLHVIKHATKITVTSRNGDVWTPVSIAFDQASDLALLRLETASKHLPIPHGPSDSVKVGNPISVIGDPLGLARSLSTGVVGTLWSDKGVRLIQVTAPISPGSSGGPVIDSKGKAIGVISYTYSAGQNLNMAVSTKEAKRLQASSKRFSMYEYNQYWVEFDRASTTKSSEPPTNPTEISPTPSQVQEGVDLARDEIARAFGRLVGNLYDRQTRWDLVWLAGRNSIDPIVIKRLGDAKNEMDSVCFSSPDWKAIEAAAAAAQISTDDLETIRQKIESIRRISSDRFDSEYELKQAALTGTKEKIEKQAFEKYTQYLRMNTALKELIKAIKEKPWSRPAEFDNSIPAVIKACWVIESKFAAYPDLDISGKPVIRACMNGSPLVAGDVVTDVALDYDGALFISVSKWDDFYNFYLNNDSPRIKLKVNRVSQGQSGLVIKMGK